MGIDYGVDQLSAAVHTLAGGDGPLDERLQAVWVDHVQQLWSSVHLPQELNSRFKTIWSRYTAPSDDPRSTTLRIMTEAELQSAAGDIVNLALDVVAARAAGEEAAEPPGR